MTYKLITHAGEPHYGKQLLVDARGCNTRLRDISTVSEFLASVPPSIGMRAFGKPLVERFGDHDEVGISAVQLLYNSAVVMHTNDMHGDLYLDLFSCKEFEVAPILAEIASWFVPVTVEHQVIFRR